MARNIYLLLLLQISPQFCTHVIIVQRPVVQIACSALGVVFSIYQFLHSFCFCLFLNFFFISQFFPSQFSLQYCKGCTMWCTLCRLSSLGAVFSINRFLHSTRRTRFPRLKNFQTIIKDPAFAKEPLRDEREQN